ncbi:cytokine receptor-like [Drosophila takahashii]|uniref:cytokine receptor-like n=1 Tax=Drosophila takahashii TaxID=29030 RepID=UPI001CF82E9C|nr:cytokine receptor-like [Drosophila takahashii]
MRKPGWPSNEPHIEQSGFAICVNFGFSISQPFNKSDSYKWKVELKPQNPAIEKQKTKVISYLEAGFNQRKDLCFRIPPFHYQSHEVHLRVRFNRKNAPWSDDEKKLSFTTKASVPDKPPEFLDNGFFFDPQKNEMHVFWLELKELEFNGPNFTYSVATDTGKKPLLKGKSSAVFCDWDLQQPSTILVWSQNSLGRSLESNNRSVPILTNYKRRQPRNLQFHLVDNTLSWDPPLEEKNVTGYYFSLCLEVDMGWRSYVLVMVMGGWDPRMDSMLRAGIGDKQP